ncbi:hypothetical protein A7K95_06305 [Pediococcus parvulus]|uniref:Uncharacterized protein n=1 Tax=Pediococcus parvulus TaxID=54062 RepID=A0ABX2UGR3_9LACO|nr:hypothetical protein A7K95_06305 [Pediococcus parvulus]
MKLKKTDFLLCLICFTEMFISVLLMKKMTIFQYMLFVQIIPVTLFSIFLGKVLSNFKRIPWLTMIIITGIFTLILAIVFKITPMT